MKHKKTIKSVAFLLLGLGGLNAQENPTASGGEATGAGGTASYSVGQVVYTAATGTNGSITQGVQQPYEISVTTGVNKTTINLELSVYPNPTTDYLTLKVEDNTELNYHIYDNHGKIIANKKVTATTSTINLESLPKATYFLNVVNNSQVLKTFKIIKN